MRDNLPFFLPLPKSWFVKISLRRRHAPMVGSGSFSHKMDYNTIFSEILNLEGHQNKITGSRVTVILLNVLKVVKLVNGGSVINGAYPV